MQTNRPSFWKNYTAGSRTFSGSSVGLTNIITFSGPQRTKSIHIWNNESASSLMFTLDNATTPASLAVTQLRVYELKGDRNINMNFETNKITFGTTGGAVGANFMIIFDE